MRSYTRSVFAVVLALLVVGVPTLCIAEAGTSSPGLPQSLAATAMIEFGGSSTLHDFHGSVRAEGFTLKSTGAPGKQKWSADIKVSTRKMSTDNTQRDSDMYKMFNVDQFPEIEGTLKEVATPALGSIIPMDLKIRDSKKLVLLTITQWKADESGVEATATGQVSLSAYGLKPPSVLGVVKVKDAVWLSISVKAQAGKKPAVKGAAR